MTSSFMGVGPHRWQCNACECVHLVSLTSPGTYITGIEAVTRFKTPAALQAISPKVGADIREGIRAANAGCPRAATVMLRRGLEGACKNAGSDKPTLADKIKSLEKSGVLTPIQAGQAHLVRSIANQYGAHADDDYLDDVSDEELETLIRLAVNVAEGLARAAKQSRLRRTGGDLDRPRRRLGVGATLLSCGLRSRSLAPAPLGRELRVGMPSR